MGEFKTQVETTQGFDDNTTRDAINETITAIAKIPGWLSIIVILAIVGILLAIVFSVLPKAGGGTTAQI